MLVPHKSKTNPMMNVKKPTTIFDSHFFIG